MTEAFIVDAVRTPVGRRGGGLAAAHPADLGGHVIRAVLDRADADPAAVDDVVFGCVDTIGPQAGDIARTAWLAAGLPEAVPGVTVDRQCGSSQQAVHFAAQAVLSGTADLVVGRGAEHQQDPDRRRHARRARRTGWLTRSAARPAGTPGTASEEVSQFRAADLIAEKRGLSRGEMRSTRWPAISGRWPRWTGACSGPRSPAMPG